MERLRHLAGLDPAHVQLIGLEAAETLVACADDPAELVVACRRLLDRHPAAGPLWWVASKALTAADPRAALTAAARELEEDPTHIAVDVERANRPDAVLAEAWSFGPGGLHTHPAAVHAALAGHAAGRPVLVIGGRGRALPTPVWKAAVARARVSPPPRPVLMEWGCVTAVVGPERTQTPAEAVADADCPIAPELLRVPI